MDKLIIIVLVVFALLYLLSSIKEHFDNTSNIQLKDLAAYQCKHLTEEEKKIQVYMESCNSPNKAGGTREEINDKRQCVDNNNRKIFNDRDRDLWCAAKDDKPFVSPVNMKVSPNPVPDNDHDIEATNKITTLPINMIQNDFDSLNNPRSSQEKVVDDQQLEDPKPLAPATPTMPISLTESVSNFPNQINTVVRASGMLNKYDLLKPPYLQGVDSGISMLYSEVQ